MMAMILLALMLTALFLQLSLRAVSGINYTRPGRFHLVWRIERRHLYVTLWLRGTRHHRCWQNGVLA